MIELSTNPLQLDAAAATQRGASCAPTSGSEARQQMGMMCWMATEGGRKCPQCGRYAKPETLGNLSFYTTGSVVARISMYGHLRGYGCNKNNLPAGGGTVGQARTNLLSAPGGSHQNAIVMAPAALEPESTKDVMAGCPSTPCSALLGQGENK